MYILPLSDLVEEVYAYQDPTSDEAIMSEISPLLVHFKELCISKINIQGHDNKQFPSRRSFVFWKQHSDITSESLSELWGVGQKRANATLLATTQNGKRSNNMPLSQCY